MTNVTVYTALIGRHELLQPQPLAASSGARWICFTDDPTLVSDDWEIIVVEPAFPTDPVRSARRIKILGPEGGLDTELGLWIDNRVTLTRPPEELVEELLDGHEIAAFNHSFHATLLDEFVAVVESAHDDTARVHEQLFHYARADVGGDALLGARPIWTGFLARRRSAAIDEAMQTWWEHVLRYSRRDQLSLPYALSVHDLSPRLMDGDNRSSDFHEWPRVTPTLGRKDRASIDRLLLAPLEELKFATDRLAIQEDEHRRERARTTGEAERAHGRARRAESRAQELLNELEEAREIAGSQRRAAGRSRRRAEALEAELGAKTDIEARLSAAETERERLSRRVAEIEASRAWRLVSALRRNR